MNKVSIFKLTLWIKITNLQLQNLADLFSQQFSMISTAQTHSKPSQSLKNPKKPQKITNQGCKNPNYQVTLINKIDSIFFNTPNHGNHENENRLYRKWSIIYKSQLIYNKLKKSGQ
jgi:hypothetical protein